MKNLRSYLASGIPSPSHSKRMEQKQKQKREPFHAGERANRKVLRQIKRSTS